jgi:hypothetical protein
MYSRWRALILKQFDPRLIKKISSEEQRERKINDKNWLISRISSLNLIWKKIFRTRNNPKWNNEEVLFVHSLILFFILIIICEEKGNLSSRKLIPIY